MEVEVGTFFLDLYGKRGGDREAHVDTSITCALAPVAGNATGKRVISRTKTGTTVDETGTVSLLFFFLVLRTC